MRPQPQPAQIHLVVNHGDQSRNKGEIWATKYLGATNERPSRLKYWQVNSSLEIIGEIKTVSWDNSYRGLDTQLQAALGAKYYVMHQGEALQAVTDYALLHDLKDEQ